MLNAPLARQPRSDASRGGHYLDRGIVGTEAGVTEPTATFSTCFAAPFLPLHPTRYAELLRERLTKHSAPVWLVNTRLR